MDSLGVSWAINHLNGNQNAPSSNSSNSSSVNNKSNFSNDELDNIMNKCADQMNGMNLIEAEPITVAVKITSQCGLELAFEFSNLNSNLKQFDSVTQLNENVYKQLVLEGFGTYDIHLIVDLMTGERLFHESLLTDRHTYHIVVGPKAEDPDQRRVKIKLSINDRSPQNVGRVISLKKLNGCYGKFVSCEKSHLVAHNNEHFKVTTEPIKSSNSNLLNGFDQEFIVNLQEHLTVVKDLRTFLIKNGDEIHEAIDKVINSGALPFIVKCLKTPNVELQFEASWILINLSAGTQEQTKLVVESGAVEVLIRLIDSDDLKIVENVFWAFTNMAYDEKPSFAQFLQPNLIQKLNRMISKHFLSMDERLVTIILDFVQNVCVDDFATKKWNRIHSELIRSIFNFLTSSNDVFVLSTLQTLVHLTSHCHRVIEVLSQHDKSIFVIKLIHHQNAEICLEVLKLIGNVLAGPNHCSSVYLRNNVLDSLSVVIDDENPCPCIFRCLSNIAAGTSNQVMQLVRSGLIQRTIPFLTKDLEACQEIVWIVENMVRCSGRKLDDLNEIIESGIFKLLHECLQSVKEGKHQKELVQSINEFLEKCSKKSDYLREKFFLEINERFEHELSDI